MSFRRNKQTVNNSRISTLEELMFNKEIENAGMRAPVSAAWLLWGSCEWSRAPPSRGQPVAMSRLKTAERTGCSEPTLPFP